MFRAARFVAAAILAAAALVSHYAVREWGDGVGAGNGASAVEEDFDAIDDADWDFLEVTAVEGRTPPSSERRPDVMRRLL